jgi:hypothetical protein
MKTKMYEELQKHQLKLLEEREFEKANLMKENIMKEKQSRDK